MKTTRLRAISLGLAVFVTCFATPTFAEIRPEYLLYSDPDLTVPAPLPPKLDDRIVPLWLQALAQPDAEIRRMAADSFRAAHNVGHPGLEAARPELLKLLADPELPDLTRTAVVQALIALDTRDAAEPLFQLSQSGPLHFKQLIEPTLAAWDFAPLRALWLARLQTAATPRRELLLAIDGFTHDKNAEAVPLLLLRVLDAQVLSDIRLAAARSCGTIAATGLEDTAQQLAPSAEVPLINRLCAVSLLRTHTSDTARVHLAELAQDPEPSIAAAALDTLFIIDPALLLPLAEGAMANADANVRWQGQRAYATLPTPERVLVLGQSLEDLHPRNRGYVREELFRLAQQPELDSSVREAGTAALARDGWRSQEQAALLLGALDHEPAAPRLVALLEVDRGEVMIAAAWALKTLQVADTLPALLDKATRQHASPQGQAPTAQLGHLFETFAVMDYQPAVPLMREQVPKRLGYEIARSAAIWGLGHIFKDKPDKDLAAELIVRARDFGTPPADPPEDDLVRKMSSVSLGRMKMVEHLEALKTLSDKAAAWAVFEISGETMPEKEPVIDIDRGWFLEPLKN